MNVLLELMRQNTHANQRILEACRDLDADQLATELVGTYGNIGATLVHIANGQVGYAARLLDRERPERLLEDPYPGFEAVAERFARGNTELEEAVSRDDWDRRVQITGDDPPGTWLMPVGLFLVQAANHGTEHRAQIAAILTTLGIEPPEVDGWAYFMDSGLLEVV